MQATSGRDRCSTESL